MYDMSRRVVVFKYNTSDEYHNECRLNQLVMYDMSRRVVVLKYNMSGEYHNNCRLKSASNVRFV